MTSKPRTIEPHREWTTTLTKERTTSVEDARDQIVLRYILLRYILFRYILPRMSPMSAIASGLAILTSQMVKSE